MDERARSLRHCRCASGLRPSAAVWILAAALALGGCAQQVETHGQLFHDNDLQQVSPGMTQDQVKLALGTPTMTTFVGQGNAFYYVSSKTQGYYFTTAHETSRQVVAVYFTSAGLVDHIANYGLKDGKIFDYVTSTTKPADTRDEGILQQLFRNLGKKQLIGGDG